MNFLIRCKKLPAQASCSTCPPGGNQVDGLPPARNTLDPTNKNQCSVAGICYLRRRKFKFLKTSTLKV